MVFILNILICFYQIGSNLLRDVSAMNDRKKIRKREVFLKNPDNHYVKYNQFSKILIIDAKIDYGYQKI